MTVLQEQLRQAWLYLVQAADAARTQSTDLIDDWSFIASVLTDARYLLEGCSSGEGFSPVLEDELPAGSCAELIRSAVAAIQSIPREDEPPQVLLAFLAATDALHLVQRQPAACLHH